MCAAAAGSKPVLPRLRSKLQSALSPRGGDAALAVPAAGRGARLVPGGPGGAAAAPRPASVQAAQLAALLRHLHRPPRVGPPPDARAVPGRVRHLLRGGGGRGVDHQSALPLYV